jgi:predicted amidohydrolase YtcJ
MATDLILTASTIITMDEALPRARAVAIDSATGRITAIGSVSEVKSAAPGVPVTDLGGTVLMPGFVEPHSHPLLSGMATQKPAYWVSPNVGIATWDDVKAIFAKADKENPADRTLVFNGVDRLLQQAPLPTRSVLDPTTRATASTSTAPRSHYWAGRTASRPRIRSAAPSDARATGPATAPPSNPVR